MMNFFKLYIGDYQRDTAHLSIAEHGAYLLMLQHYYATENPLPIGKALHRMLRVQDKAERDAVDSVVTKFWTESEDGLINVRADAEIRKADHQRTVNREIGKRGGRPKQTEQITESVSCSVIGSVSESEPNDNPNQTPDKRKNLKPPQPPKGGRQPISFKAWLAELKLKAEKPIPPDDPVFDYCSKVGIPEEFLTLHWRLFKAKYLEVDKRQRDWRRVLRNSVRGNWLRVWYVGQTGEATLTTVGIQAQREFGEAA